MTFEREKRLLMGWLALLAPVPLPFNQVLEWPALFVYELLVIVFLQRSDEGKTTRLPNWVLNLLGLVYLPFFVVDVRWSFLRGSPVKALLHLILFLVVVKLFTMQRESEKWQVLAAIFFVFIGAMATSSHVTIGLYLLVFGGVSFFALTRLSHLHLLGRFAKGRGPVAEPLPMRMPSVVGMLAILLVAIPLFAAVPRVREPFLLGRGGAGIGRTTGFSDSVNLNLTTSIRGNRNVALRVQYEGPVSSPENLRFKGAAYDRYENRRWFRQTRHYKALNRDDEGWFQLPAENPPAAASKATLYLEPIPSISVIIPAETLALQLPSMVRQIGIDLGGALLLPGQRRETVRYEVELAAEPVIAAQRSAEAESELGALDTNGLTPRMADLSRELMGEGTVDERVDRLEQRLLTDYGYTSDFVDRDGVEPLEDFLFEFKSGHCELFASAMVLMLRSEGVPARLVTGFLGAEYNPLEDYYIVRQENAHAWVEAHTPERGWRIYDPTPPEGRPSIAPRSLKLFFTQLADYVTFRWDRYVLTYGAEDQGRFFKNLRERLVEWWKRFREGAEDETGDPSQGAEGESTTTDAEGHRPVWQPSRRHLGVMALIFAALAGWIVWRRRPPTGEDAYLRLRRLLESDGTADELDSSTAPLEIRTLAHERWPGAGEAIARLIGLYLRESFAGEPLPLAERRRLAEALRVLASAERGRRKSERQRPKRAA